MVETDQKVQKCFHREQAVGKREDVSFLYTQRVGEPEGFINSPCKVIDGKRFSASNIHNYLYSEVRCLCLLQRKATDLQPHGTEYLPCQ